MGQVQKDSQRGKSPRSTQENNSSKQRHDNEPDLDAPCKTHGIHTNYRHLNSPFSDEEDESQINEARHDIKVHTSTIIENQFGDDILFI